MKQLLFLMLGIGFLCACNKDEDPEPMDDSQYGPCCELDAIDFEFGDTKLYVPNMFTPNADGINDVFYPFLDTFGTTVNRFAVFNRDGGLIHEVINTTPTSQVGSWDGLDNGLPYAGWFEFKVDFTDVNGFNFNVDGKACAFRCDTTVALIQHLNNCHFPTQHNGDGGLDVGLDDLETDCFN